MCPLRRTREDRHSAANLRGKEVSCHRIRSRSLWCIGKQPAEVVVGTWVTNVHNVPVPCSRETGDIEALGNRFLRKAMEVNMSGLFCSTESLEVSVPAGVSIADITSDLQGIVQRAGMRTGTLNATCIGSTGSLTTSEYEPGVVQDLQRAIRELAPPERDYEHEKAWHDGNGHSHVQAALLGPSLALPMRQGRVFLGTWQQAVIINHDIDSRRRGIEVTLVGDSV